MLVLFNRVRRRGRSESLGNARREGRGGGNREMEVTRGLGDKPKELKKKEGKNSKRRRR